MIPDTLDHFRASTRCRLQLVVVEYRKTCARPVNKTQALLSVEIADHHHTLITRTVNVW